MPPPLNPIDNIEIKVVLDSVNPANCRLTTFELTYPYWTHGQMMAHRAFGRNAASNRAIPTKKLIERTRAKPAWPVYWGRNAPGMQAPEELSGDALTAAHAWWDEVIDTLLTLAERGAELQVHKEVVNRVLFPVQHMTIILTGTDFENFFKLRDHGAAQHEIQVLARKMKLARAESTPQSLAEGEWHLPYTTAEDRAELPHSELIKVSAARCARVSYLTHDGVRAIAKDLGLHETLLSEMHMSPFEHPCKALRSSARVGPFRGWQQYRKTIVGESGESEAVQDEASELRQQVTALQRQVEGLRAALEAEKQGR